MKKLLAVMVGLAALGALAVSRPGNEYLLLTLLNGQENRWGMSDGGVSGMYGTGQQCMPLAGVPVSSNGVLEVMPTVPINLCMRSTALLQGPGGTTWDGGCNAIAGDINFGVPLQPYVPKFVSIGTATHLCQVSDGGTAATPVFALQ